MDGFILSQIISLVLLLLNVMHSNNNWVYSCYKFIVIDFTVTPSLNSSNHSNELLISCIEAMHVEESVKIEMRDLSLVLAINLSECSLSVPTRASVEALFEHFQFQMAVDLSLEIISHGFSN